MGVGRAAVVESTGACGLVSERALPDGHVEAEKARQGSGGHEGNCVYLTQAKQISDARYRPYCRAVNTHSSLPMQRNARLSALRLWRHLLPSVPQELLNQVLNSCCTGAAKTADVLSCMPPTSVLLRPLYHLEPLLAPARQLALLRTSTISPVRPVDRRPRRATAI